MLFYNAFIHINKNKTPNSPPPLPTAILPLNLANFYDKGINFAEKCVKCAKILNSNAWIRNLNFFNLLILILLRRFTEREQVDKQKSGNHNYFFNRR